MPKGHLFSNAYCSQISPVMAVLWQPQSVRLQALFPRMLTERLCGKVKPETNTYAQQELSCLELTETRGSSCSYSSRDSKAGALRPAPSAPEPAGAVPERLPPQLQPAAQQPALPARTHHRSHPCVHHLVVMVVGEGVESGMPHTGCTSLAPCASLQCHPGLLTTMAAC